MAVLRDTTVERGVEKEEKAERKGKKISEINDGYDVVVAFFLLTVRT